MLYFEKLIKGRSYDSVSILRIWVLGLNKLKNLAQDSSCIIKTNFSIPLVDAGSQQTPYAQD